MAADRRAERLAALGPRLGAAGIDALLVSSVPNIRYLTGFTGTAGLLVVRTGAPPVLVVVNGLGAGPVAALEAGRISGAAATATPEDITRPGLDQVAALERIVREGPEVGVHALVWTDRLSSLAMHVSRATMREFALRVVMQMPAEDSALPIHVLGAGVDDDVGAELHRLLQERGREDIVHHDDRARRMRQIADSGQIDQLKHGVGGRFEQDERSRRGQRALPLIEVGAVHELGADAVAWKQGGNDPVAGAEQGAARHQAISGLQMRKQRRVDRGAAARAPRAWSSGRGRPR